MPMPNSILNFWFHEIDPSQWWIASADFDERVRSRFGALLQQAAAGELSDWRDSPRGRVAEVIVLDQFSRNVWRDTPQAFAQDGMALALSQEAVRQGALEAAAGLTQDEQVFLLMPYMHSESAKVHRDAERLFLQVAPDANYQFELRHKAIIDRFGRYPHRNAILGRNSTPEEIEFLQKPGSRF